MHKRYSTIRVKINCDNEFKFSNLGNRHGWEFNLMANILM